MVAWSSREEGLCSALHMRTQPHSRGKCEREVICSSVPFVRHKLLLFSRLERNLAPLCKPTAVRQVRNSLWRFLLLISTIRLQRNLFFFHIYFKKEELDVRLEKESHDFPRHMIFLDRKSQGSHILEKPLKVHLFSLHLVSLQLAPDWSFNSQCPPAPNCVQHHALAWRLEAHIEPVLLEV